VLQGFDPDASGGFPKALAVSGSRVFLGGTFSVAGGAARSAYAAVDSTSGLADSWNPQADDGLTATVAVSGSHVYIGGSLKLINWVTRNNAAAINADSGAVDPTWDPNVNNTVRALASSGSLVYLGGDFAQVGSTGRTFLAAVDSSTGAVNSTFNPAPNALVDALVVNGSTLYLGGDFTSVAGATHNLAAAVNATSGADTGFDPNVDPAGNNEVTSIAVSPSLVYLGGAFDTVGTGAGNARANLAAVNPSTGALDPTWDPGANNIVRTLVVSGANVYIGGEFTSLDGRALSNLAVVDASSGTANQFWNPNPDGAVNAITASGGLVFIGGSFANVGGGARQNLAAVNAGTPTADVWNPGANGVVSALGTTAGGQILAGGAFSVVGDSAQRGFAEFGSSAPTNLARPSVDGPLQVGGALTCSPGVWANSPTSFAYQWLQNGNPVGTATPTYTVAAADAGQLLACRVTASNGVGSSSATSENVAIPGSGSGGGGAGTNPGGTTSGHGPSVKLRGSTKQRVVSQKGVVVGASCNQACTLTATGTVSIKGAAKVFRFTKATKKLRKAGNATLKLKASKKVLAAIRSALKHHKHLTAVVRITAKGSNGKTTT
jgi:hypothetical protein